MALMMVGSSVALARSTDIKAKSRSLKTKATSKKLLEQQNKTKKNKTKCKERILFICVTNYSIRLNHICCGWKLVNNVSGNLEFLKVR